ncbi:TIR domain-containing protein [Acaryochloris marina]|uniref:TIR domain-containing protein n=1 Tax=Acaryochloris marina TaxID=155978 RepID=UPI0021C36A23|nr:TIR domain-containing protein [Acaryochloris marina]
MTERKFKYDVFLSHSSQDKPTVLELAEKLRADGLRVWLDDWMIQPGDLIPAKIAEGLEQSHTLVLCMSQNAFGSDWVTLEHQTILFRDPINKERRFIPILLDEEPINDSLRPFAHIDWRQPTLEQYNRILKACQPPAPVDKSPNQEQTTLHENDILNPTTTGVTDARLERFLAGHTANVWSVALTADGRRALSGSADKTVKFWDLDSGQCLQTLEGHDSDVGSIALTPDGRRALSGSADKTIKLWDLDSGQCLQTLEGHIAYVESIALSADGRRALSGSADKTVKLWDLNSGKCLQTLQGHTDDVSSVALSADGHRALSGSADKTVKLWDLDSGQCLQNLQGHTANVWSVALDADGRRALSGSSDRTVKLWDLNSGQCIQTLRGHTASIESVALTTDGCCALSGSSDRTVKFWDLDSGQCLQTLEGHTAIVGSVALATGGCRAVSGSADRIVKLWDLDSGQCLQTLEGHTANVWSVALAADGCRAVSGSADQTIRLWDLDSGQCLQTLEGHTANVWSVALTADGCRAVSSSADQTIRLWDLDSGQCLQTLEGHTSDVGSIVLTPDGCRALSGSSDRTVKLWDLDSGQCLQTLEGHIAYVWSVTLSVDGRRALSGSSDRTVKLWDLDSGQCLQTLEGHTANVGSVAFTIDGHRALSGSADRTVKLWDLDSGQCLQTLEGHTANVGSVALTADGCHALSGSDDQTVKLWDLDSGQCLKSFEGHTDSVRSVILQPCCYYAAARNGRLLGWSTEVQPTSVQSSAAARYTNAKVVLVGESGVGKTGLALRLTQNRFEATISTDAHWATQLRLPHDNSPDGIDREIWLWDFAGQADYRLIHQLFMDETALAVLVFNPQSEDPFEGLSQWDREITRAAQRPFKKLLVAGRCDRGRLMVSQSRIQQFAQNHSFVQYLETSALSGHGCQDLKTAIIDEIDWDSIPHTSSPRIFKLLKDEILQLRDQGFVLFRISELKQQMEMRLPEEQFSLAQLRAVVGLLAGPGIVWKLEFGDFVLLQPEWINKYAAAVIRSVREIGEIGIINEDKILRSDLNFTLDYRPTDNSAHEGNGTNSTPQQMDRLDAIQEDIILRAMHQTLVDRGICSRTSTPSGMELIFPSYCKRELPEDPGHPPLLVTYRFKGFLEEIYATLVVRLRNTPVFENGDLWRFAADFHSPTGARMGLLMERKRDGAGEISVYFEAGVTDDLKVMFTKYVHEHLLTKGKDTLRLRHFICPHCGHPVRDTELAHKKLEEDGHQAQIRCQNCDQKFVLWDLMEQKFADPEFQQKVRDLEAKAKSKIDHDSQELILKGHAFSVAQETGQTFRVLAQSNWGVDHEIEFKDWNGNPSGQRVYLQLKPRESFAYEHQEGQAVLIHASPDLCSYWQQQAYPVMLVLRDNSGDILWMNVTAACQDSERVRPNFDRSESTTSGPLEQTIIFQGEPFTALNLQRIRDQLLPPR